ncbi:hypothetical protein F4819DRAFT_469166 [Hypoxylon fuscum]|nr:hypothetical protein F4819DRAFT_469166 [Hypoxylon fuscum]
MRLLNRNTTMPIPEVFDFSSTTKNSLKRPYIMMSLVTGKSLYDVWFSHRLQGVSHEDVLKYRTRALTDVARAMVQLSSFSFDQGGALVFDAAGELSGVAPSRLEATLDHCTCHEGSNNFTVYAERAVTDSTKKYYTAPLDLEPKQKPINCALNTLLRLLISWIPEPESEKPFVLEFPGFDIQNIIVEEDGKVLAMLGWDDAEAVPRSYGNMSYPGWLTRDWDPPMYAFVPSMDDGVEREGYLWEDSPAELRRGDLELSWKQPPRGTPCRRFDL